MTARGLSCKNSPTCSALLRSSANEFSSSRGDSIAPAQTMTADKLLGAGRHDIVSVRKFTQTDAVAQQHCERPDLRKVIGTIAQRNRPPAVVTIGIAVGKIVLGLPQAYPIPDDLQAVDVVNF